MTLPRPLTPLERALLRAVVELGDNCYGVPLRQAAEASTRRSVILSVMYAAMDRLEEEGFVRSFDIEGEVMGTGRQVRRYWRPVGDLTTMLGGEGGGEREA